MPIRFNKECLKNPAYGSQFNKLDHWFYPEVVCSEAELESRVVFRFLQGETSLTLPLKVVLNEFEPSNLLRYYLTYNLEPGAEFKPCQFMRCQTDKLGKRLLKKALTQRLGFTAVSDKTSILPESLRPTTFSRFYEQDFIKLKMYHIPLESGASQSQQYGLSFTLLILGFFDIPLGFE